MNPTDLTPPTDTPGPASDEQVIRLPLRRYSDLCRRLAAAEAERDRCREELATCRAQLHTHRPDRD